MEVETEGGEQKGIASQSIEKDVQTDVAGSDIDSLCLARFDAQELTANFKYHVLDKKGQMQMKPGCHLHWTTWPHRQHLLSWYAHI